MLDHASRVPTLQGAGLQLKPEAARVCRLLFVKSELICYFPPLFGNIGQSVAWLLYAGTRLLDRLSQHAHVKIVPRNSEAHHVIGLRLRCDNNLGIVA